MSFQKASPNIGSVQKIMSTLKQFERKLDNLQNDVNYHGKTLKELQTLVIKLSGGTIVNPDNKPDDLTPARIDKTNTAIQYDKGLSNKDSPNKLKRKHPVQPIPTKSFQNHGGVKPHRCPFLMENKSSSPRTLSVKQSPRALRPSKAEAPRKASSLRTQKGMVDKKRSNTM